MDRDGYLFHGGCIGCTNSLAICPACQYMEPNWSLPDLNPKTKNEKEKRELMKKLAYQLHASIRSSDGHLH